MADPFDSSPERSPRPVPTELSAGLDLFAAAWLQKWSEEGGFVQLVSDGKALFGFPVYQNSPAFCESAAALPEAVCDRQSTWRDGHYQGRMRSLLDLLETLPEGANAVKAHMLSHGLRSYCGATGAKP